MKFGGDHPAHGHGKVSPRCVPVLPAVARLCPDAFPKGPRTGKTPVRGNISPACIQIQLILARYAWHVSEKPRRAPLGNAPREHLAAKGRFRRPKPSDHARRTNLATLRWPCPCAGAPARATASRDRLSTAWPLPRGACPRRPADTRHPPMPAACRARCSQRQAADGLRRRSSGSWPAVRPSPEGPPTASSRRAGRQRSAAQNLRRRPQARPGLRQRCRKRPSKGRVSLDGTIGTPHPFPIAQKSRPQELTPGSALSAFLAAYSPSEFQAVLRSAPFRLDAVRFSGLPRLLSSDSAHRN